MSFLGAVKVGKEVGDAAGGIISAIGNVFDELFTSDEEREAAKFKLFQLFQSGALTELDSRIKVLLAEMNGNWLQRSWRPILMLVCIFIVFNNYVLFPYLKLFFPDAAVQLNLDQNIWDLMKIGIGGYTACRTIDKGIKEWRKNS